MTPGEEGKLTVRAVAPPTAAAAPVAAAEAASPRPPPQIIQVKASRGSGHEDPVATGSVASIPH